MVIDIDVEMHVLDNQMVKIHSERLSHLVPYKRGESSGMQHILSLNLKHSPNRRCAGSARRSNTEMKCLKHTNYQ